MFESAVAFILLGLTKQLNQYDCHEGQEAKSDHLRRSEWLWLWRRDIRT